MIVEWNYDAPPEKWLVGMLILVENVRHLPPYDGTGGSVVTRRVAVVGTYTIEQGYDYSKPYKDRPAIEAPATWGGYECDADLLRWGPQQWDEGIVAWHPGISAVVASIEPVQTSP